MCNKIHHPLKAVALAALLFFTVISCKQNNGGSTSKTPIATTTSPSNINNMAQNGMITNSRDTTPNKIINEPPPPPPPSPSATSYPMAYSDILEAKGMAMSMRACHISGVKASVVNDTVTLTGNASKKDLRTILIIANQYRPKKVINKMTVK